MNERQGVDQIPTVHLGIAASAMEKRAGRRIWNGNGQGGGIVNAYYRHPDLDFHLPDKLEAAAKQVLLQEHPFCLLKCL